MGFAMKGKVKFTDETKGFGFIRGDDGNDYYFKLRDLIGTENISGGSFVTFSRENSDKGAVAKNVSPFTPDISDKGYFKYIKHKDPSVTAARILTKDHFGFGDAIKPIKGLGFLENLKLMVLGIALKFVGMIFTIIFSVYFIVIFIPYFLFGGEILQPTKDYFYFMIIKFPALIWKYTFE